MLEKHPLLSVLSVDSDRKGVLWKLFSTLCFAVATLLMIPLSRGPSALPTIQIAFLLAVVPFLVMVAWVKVQGARLPKHLLITQDPVNGVARGLCGCVAFICWYKALGLLPLGILAAFRLLGPLVTFGGALIFLGERASFKRIMVLTLTLVGALCVIAGDLFSGKWAVHGELQLGAFCLPLVTIVGFAGCNLFGKRLMGTVGALEATLSLLAINAVVLGILSVGVWQNLTLFQWGMCGGASLLEVAAQLSLSRALRLTQVSLLVPVSLWSFGLKSLGGIFFFHEPFSLTLWIGVGLMLWATTLILKRPTV